MECVFCAIIGGQLPGEFLYQDDAVVAIKDVNPQAPVHLLIIPRRHIPTLLDLDPADEGLMGHICNVATQVATEQQISAEGFRLVVNCGLGAGQSVFHIHFHLMGGRTLHWPPG